MKVDPITGIDEVSLELGRGSEIGMAIALAVMMLSVALSLNVSSFGFLRRAPKPFLVGAFLQLLALPVLTLVLCYALKPSPSIALGMILVACCPGGNVSNMLVLLARGNAALSVSLTAFSSLAAAFITPLAIVFWCGLYPPTSQLLQTIDFNPWSFLVQTSVILVLPLILGIAINHFFTTFAQRVKRPLVVLSSGLLFAIIMIGGIKYWQTFLLIGGSVLGLVVLHNALAFFMGNMSARLFKLETQDQRALTFEVGIQNAGLGIVILLTQLGGLGGAAVVAGLWGIWHIIAGLCLVVTFVLTDRLNSQ